MDPKDIKKLRSLTSFPALVDYLRDELDWPIEVEDADELTFDYDPAELGIDPKHAVKIESIKQIRPLVDDQSWGIFYIQFESKRLPVVVLRRILGALVPKSRGRDPDRPVWRMENLLFVSAFGDARHDQREIAFAHFHQEEGGLPTLRVLGWDGGDTPLKLEHVAATLKQRLCWPEDPSDADAWRAQWTPAFRHKPRHVIKTADALAGRLAELARDIRDAANTLMRYESAGGPLRRLHKAFQTALIHDLSESDFADTYAQTITYGLLTAAISRTEMSEGRYGTALVAGNVTDMVPITNPFLREMLDMFLRAGGRQGGIDFDELGVQEVVDLLRGDETDLPAVVRDFGNRTQHEDPVIYFYEEFAKRYDPVEKVRRGEFYTPQPVVSYIVRSVHELLQSELGLEDGLASTVTWGEMTARHEGMEIPDGTDPESPFVTILDPATGTGTFPVEVIDVIYCTLTGKWQKQGLSRKEQAEAWNEYVPKHLLPRLYGYELKMAPYAIAHMRIGLKLKETGFTAWDRLGDEDRVRVYLTNALEPATDERAQLAFAEWAPALAHEAQSVNFVKRRECFTVVIGNPPYARISQNMGTWISNLIEDFKYVDGVHFREIKHWLHDDYVKFVRLGHLLLNRGHCGILGMITNRGYLSGPTFRGMRNFIWNRSSNLHILDLHGGALQEERQPPPGVSDKNVFDIKQGVAISIAVVSPRQSPECTKTYSQLWGTRQSKYTYLKKASARTQPTEKLVATSPRYDFVPVSSLDIDSEYSQYVAVNEIFRVGSTAIQTSRDAYVVDFDRTVLEKRFEEFVDPRIPDAFFRTRYGLKDGRNWNLADARRTLASDANWRDSQVLCQFRPLDFRWMLYHASVINWPRPEVMPHMLAPNVALIVPRNYQGGHFDAALVSRFITEVKTGESTRGSYCYPLYLYDTDGLFRSTPSKPRHNLSRATIRRLSRALQLEFVSSGCGDLESNFGPEDVLHYLYSLLYSNGYRQRYSEFIKGGFPRLPLSGNLDLFSELAQLGGDLVSIHLLESSVVDQHISTFVMRATGARVGAFSKSTCYEDGRVYLDTSQRSRSSCFEGVPRDVWNFTIGGYQVLYKWLYDRRGVRGDPGRALTEEDIDHYQRIVVALKETMRLMGEIDEVIEAYGGWPIE